MTERPLFVATCRNCPHVGKTKYPDRPYLCGACYYTNKASGETASAKELRDRADRHDREAERYRQMAGNFKFRHPEAGPSSLVSVEPAKGPRPKMFSYRYVPGVLEPPDGRVEFESDKEPRDADGLTLTQRFFTKHLVAVDFVHVEWLRLADAFANNPDKIMLKFPDVEKGLVFDDISDVDRFLVAAGRTDHVPCVPGTRKD